MEDNEEWNALINKPQEFLDSVKLLVDDNDLDNKPKGPMTLYLRIMGENFEVTSDPQNSLPHEKEKVYWLPYKKNGVSSVTITDLQNSDCRVFLTSTFTGCRFSMTDEYIAHIPSGRKELLPDSQAMEEARSAAKSGDYSKLNQINASARDMDEQSLSGPESRARHAQVRRTLTPTKLSGMPAAQKETYKASAEYNETNPPENAVVVGVREATDQAFHFYAQITFGKKRETVDLGYATTFTLDTSEKSSEKQSQATQQHPSHQSSTSSMFQDFDVNVNQLIEQKSASHLDKKELPQEKPQTNVDKDENKRGKKRTEHPQTETTSTESNTSKKSRNETDSTENIDDSEKNPDDKTFSV